MRHKTYARLRAQVEIIERKLIAGSIYRPRPRRERRYYSLRA
jgi:hypothetical protein